MVRSPAMAPQITSASNPKLRHAHRLTRESRYRKRTRQFVCEEPRTIARALAAGFKLDYLLHCPELAPAVGSSPQQWLEHWRQHLPPGVSLAEQAAADTQARVFELPRALLAKACFRQNPSGVLAVMHQRDVSLDALSLDALSPDAAADAGPSTAAGADSSADSPATLTAGRATGPGPGRATGRLFLVATGLSKPVNLGAMARTASAAGASALLIADAVVDVLNPHAIRASTGAVFSLPVVCASSEVLEHWLIHTCHAQLFVGVPTGGKRIYDQDLTGHVALIVGAEDTGVPDRWLDAARPVSVPCPGHAVDSLNAAASAAIMLFEAVRQRS